MIELHRIALVAITALVPFANVAPPTPVRSQPTAASTLLRTAADSFVALQRRTDDGPWPDYRIATRERRDRRLDALAAQLRAPTLAELRDPAERLMLADLRETVEGRIGVRACRLDLWSTVSQIGGLPSNAATWARSVNAGDAAQFARSLDALRRLPAAFRDHQVLLQRGLDSGVTAPVPVVDVVVAQLDALLPAGDSTGPLFAALSQRPAEAAEWRRVVADSVRPTVAAYRAFLAGPYRAKARADGALASMNGGADCYRNWLRAQTSIAADPVSLMRTARSDYTQALADMAPLVARLTGTNNVVEGIRRLRSGASFAFSHRDSILPEYQRITALAASRFSRVVRGFQAESLAVVPYALPQEQAGLPPQYLSARNGQPAQFLVNLGRTERMSVADAVAHEGYPGHHLQRIASRQTAVRHAAQQEMSFGSFTEGWGIYAEDLGDAMGLYDSDLQRVGYLIHLSDVSMAFYLDVGTHMLGWTRTQLVDSMMTLAGRAQANAEAYADRHAATPGQLATYYVGWRAFRDARRDAERVLGARFDQRDFHYEVLKDGAMSLASLREKAAAWARATSQSPQ